MKSVDEILIDCKSLEPDDGPVFKFERPGDCIVARYVGRRKNVATKNANGPATCLDVEILRAIGSDIVGPATVFESGHITSIMDQKPLSLGQAFALKFHDVDRKTRFKRFAFQRYPELDASNGHFKSGAEKPDGDDNIADDVPF